MFFQYLVAVSRVNKQVAQAIYKEVQSAYAFTVLLLS